MSSISNLVKNFDHKKLDLEFIQSCLNLSGKVYFDFDAGDWNDKDILEALDEIDHRYDGTRTSWIPIVFQNKIWLCFSYYLTEYSEFVDKENLESKKNHLWRCKICGREMDYYEDEKMHILDDGCILKGIDVHKYPPVEST